MKMIECYLSILYSLEIYGDIVLIIYIYFDYYYEMNDLQLKKLLLMVLLVQCAEK